MSTRNGIDTPTINTAAHNVGPLIQSGVTVIAGYLYADLSFKQVVNRPAITIIKAAGADVYVIWESGIPESAAYFTAHIGDGELILQLAQEAGLGAGTSICLAVDYDAPREDWPAILAYFKAIHDVLKPHGYLIDVYGSGDICRYLKEAGWVNHTYLAGAVEWGGYDGWKPHADMVQVDENTERCGVSCDTFILQNTAIVGAV